jgi:carbamoyltransferase
MNVKGNKIISEMPEIKDMFIFPSAGDESTCVGAAMSVYADYLRRHGINPKKGITPVDNFYLGPLTMSEQLDELAKEYDFKEKGIQVEKMPSHDSINKWVVDNLVNGEIVARCSGRCEFGARALGNRSIMAMATNPKITDSLNAVIKQRDFWMPFAPSILEEDQHLLLHNPKNLRARWMIQAFDTTLIGSGQLAAAMHRYDKSVRPQTVTVNNGEYYWILDKFKEETGLSGFLNTSFNLHGYPIVKDARIAIETMLNSGLKYLAIDNYALTKNID